MKTGYPIGFVGVFVAALLCCTTTRAQSIVGQVKTAGGLPVQGVLVTATRTLPFQRVTDTTDAAGAYSAGSGLSGSYNVLPSKSGYTFTPASSNVIAGGGNITANFTVASGPAPTATTLSATAITATNAQLNGSANPNGVATSAYFQYGLTTGYGSVTTSSALGNGNSAVAVARVISGLTPGLTYHYRLVASNELDQSFGGDVNFSDAPAAPAATTLAATGINSASATLNGSVNPQGAATTVRFEYGFTTAYGSFSSSTNVGSASSIIPVGIAVTGLLNGTNYHFRVAASNSVGQSVGDDLTFATPSGIPSVYTLDPIGGGTTTMTLNGAVYPSGANATGWFEWGTTTNYGNVTSNQNLGGGTDAIIFTQALTGLTTAATYHYRAAGATIYVTNYGADLVFKPSFNDIVGGLPGVRFGAVAWGDYDFDGRLDILLTGESASGPIAQVWRNTGSGFGNINAGLPGVQYSAVAWGDYDNDGWLDILLTGWNLSDGLITQVWRNTGSGFTNINAGLPGVNFGSVAWGDYDNDGRQDILLTGLANSGQIAQVWRNTGNGFSNINAVLPGVCYGSVAWGDHDNDGWLDILLTGYSTNYPIAQIWRNAGNGFSNINAGLPGVAWQGSSAWGDYDNDGRLDVLLTGYDISGNPISQLWRNTGNGFSNLNAGLPGLGLSSVAWGDYDNDGGLDILLTGVESSGTAISQVWRNTGGGFVNIGAGLPVLYKSSVAWGDFDNDGRPDILLTGEGLNPILNAQVWRNNTPVTNTAPAAPSGLAASPSGTTVALNWNSANDNQTPAAGLTYNVRVGTTPSGSELLSPMAAANGFRRLPQMGNSQQRLTTVIPVQLGQTYYWSVQAVDSSFAGSPFAAEQHLTVNTVLTPPNGTPVPGDLNGDGVVSQSELDLVLSNYLPNSPWLYMTNVAGLGGTNVTFALSNSVAGAFSVEYTTNFADWLLLGPATPLYLFTDTNAPVVPQRSYRLRWP